MVGREGGGGGGLSVLKHVFCLLHPLVHTPSPRRPPPPPPSPPPQEQLKRTVKLSCNYKLFGMGCDVVRVRVHLQKTLVGALTTKHRVSYGECSCSRPVERVR